MADSSNDTGPKPPKRLRANFWEEACPFTSSDVINAFGEEVHLFIHVHMRGYDRTGEGLTKDAAYYDKYGAPAIQEDAWMDGYHSIELELAKHFDECIDTAKDFPLVAGMAGGAHLYKPVGHDQEPWNWTGWVPRRKMWCTVDTFHKNRHFLNIRGNEIQNNLWDYHPLQEAISPDNADALFDDHYEQITPLDSFEGKGYWLRGEPWGRYIHIISLKSHVKDADAWVRYNYIVHPLAYRRSINDCPDNSVDGTQWSILNIKYEKNEPKFTDPDKWGTDVHGLEIFNDFTYFHSWLKPAEDDVINIHNGTIMNYEHEDPAKKQYVYWFDTYPLEFGEFLLDTSLERGVYLHVLAANDAFYDRNLLPENERADDKGKKLHAVKKRVIMSDPKGNMIKEGSVAPNQPPAAYSKKMRHSEAAAKRTDRKRRETNDFFKNRPYAMDTAFGHTTIIDTNEELKSMMVSRLDQAVLSVDAAETLILKWMNVGKFYSHTGVYDLFNYRRTKQKLPFLIENQPDPNGLCYQMSDDMELVFHFPPCKDNKVRLIWRYSLEIIKDDNTLETVHGYFRLDSRIPTRLNLSESYDKTKLKWIQFTVFKEDNPMRRAWFNAVRGVAFGDAKPNDVPPTRTHRVVLTEGRRIKEAHEIEEVIETGTFHPFACASNELEFYFPKVATEPEEYFYVYDMQVRALLPEINKKTINTKRDVHGNFYLPERFIQNVHGYFQLNDDWPTKLKLSNSWDPKTVVDDKVYFYYVDTETGQPKAIKPEPTSTMPAGFEV